MVALGLSLRVLFEVHPFASYAIPAVFFAVILAGRAGAPSLVAVLAVYAALTWAMWWSPLYGLAYWAIVLVCLGMALAVARPTPSDEDRRSQTNRKTPEAVGAVEAAKASTLPPP